jgi:hypothetical protein
VFLGDDGGRHGLLEVLGEAVDGGLLDDVGELVLGGQLGADKEDVLEFVVDLQFGDLGLLGVPVLAEGGHVDQVGFVYEDVDLPHRAHILEIL